MKITPCSTSFHVLDALQTVLVRLCEVLGKRIEECTNDLQCSTTGTLTYWYCMLRNNHLPNWSTASVISVEFDRRTKRIVEVTYISTGEVIKHGMGFICLSRITAGIVIAQAGRQKQEDQSGSSIIKQPSR